MKKISLGFACLLFSAGAVMAQNNTLEGSGNVITKNISIKPFNAIKANGLFELILSQGNTESVKVETDDNLQYLFEISNDGSTLVIDEPKLRDHSLNFKYNGEREKRQHFKIYVTFKNLNSLDLQVIGSIRSEGSLNFDALDINDQTVGNIDLSLTATKLSVKNKGVGNISLSGKADNAVITNGGVGRFNGEDLVVQTMHIENTGIGHADVNVVKDLTIKDSFLGKVRNTGGAKTHKMDGVEI